MSIENTKLAKNNRLNKASDYRRIFKRAWRSRDNIFLVLARENDLQEARLGLVVSKKNVGRASRRNKLKRLIRENFRHHKTDLKGLDVVVIANKELLFINRKKVSRSIENHWVRLLKCKK